MLRITFIDKWGDIRNVKIRVGSGKIWCLSPESLHITFRRICLLVRFVSPEDVGWRRNVCSRDGGVLSVVIGITLTRGSSDGNRRVVGPNVAASRSRNPISNGEPRIQITSAVPMRGKGKSTERALTTRSEEHTSELQSRLHLVCRLLLEKKI